MIILQSEEYQSYKGMITILLNSINSARLPCLFGSRAELILFGENHFIAIQILQPQYYILFSLHPLVIIPTILFPLYFIRRERFVTGLFFVYICNAQRPEDRKWEDRVHTCRQPCAHGRRSFFRHSTIECAHGQ